VEQLALENAKLREAGGGTYMASLYGDDGESEGGNEDGANE
jgi:hypothetical protein